MLTNPGEFQEAPKGQADAASPAGQASAGQLPPLTARMPFIGATIFGTLILVAAWLDLLSPLPFLTLVVITLAVHLGGTALIRRGWRQDVINPLIRLTNLTAYTVAVVLFDGLHSPLIPIYVEDILSASLRDGRRGAWKGWGLVTVALTAVALWSWPLAATELIRFLVYVGVMGIIAIVAGELGQGRIEVQMALARQVIENARLYAQLEERAERLEVAYAELKELDQRKTEFIQSVSHGLRTPLFFIRGYIELLRDGGLGELNDLQREKLDTVVSKTQLLAELVRDVVSLQQGQPRPEEMRDVSLADVAREAASSATAIARELGLTLSLDLPATPPIVRGDPQRLEEVFDNLLSNAIKFSPDGGTITVSVYSQDGAVVASVADEGIGVPREEHERIFERFYQIDSTTTRRFEGTGLGLAIVKEVIEGHEGKVWLTSPTLPDRSGRGSTFYFSLPTVKQDLENTK